MTQLASVLLLILPAAGLNLPTALAFGPDDELYASVCGYGCPPEAGAVVRVDLRE
jgi:hypothetical protein